MLVMFLSVFALWIRRNTSYSPGIVFSGSLPSMAKGSDCCCSSYDWPRSITNTDLARTTGLSDDPSDFTMAVMMKNINNEKIASASKEASTVLKKLLIQTTIDERQK